MVKMSIELHPRRAPLRPPRHGVAPHGEGRSPPARTPQGKHHIRTSEGHFRQTVGVHLALGGDECFHPLLLLPGGFSRHLRGYEANA